MDDANDWMMLMSQSVILQAAGTYVAHLPHKMPHKKLRLGVEVHLKLLQDSETSAAALLASTLAINAV